MLKNSNQLDAHQLKEIALLQTLCKKEDGSVPNLYTHILEQERLLPSSLLYYKDQKLVGFLGVYFFYDDAVEVSILVHSSYRRKGIARALLHAVLPLIESQNIHHLIFSSPSERNSTWLLAQGFTFLHSEYAMVRDDLNPLLTHANSLTWHTATPDDIASICSLDEACFPKKSTDCMERMQHIINGREYLIMMAYYHNELVGKAHIRWNPTGATLSDIAVFPKYQGQGIGTKLITYCINLALSDGKPHLNLDVETHNIRALQLYTRLGFVVDNACDYWRIDLNQLPK